MAVKEIEKMMTEIGEEEVCHVIETGKGGINFLLVAACFHSLAD